MHIAITDSYYYYSTTNNRVQYTFTAACLLVSRSIHITLLSYGRLLNGGGSVIYHLDKNEDKKWHPQKMRLKLKKRDAGKENSYVEIFCFPGGLSAWLR